MKLRILGDSVRLRLSQSDVRTLLEQGRLDEHTHFAPGQVLCYAVEQKADGGPMEADLQGATIRIRIAGDALRRWADSAEISLRREQPVEGGRTLALLVEKDFKCAVPRPGEEEYDGFDNPDATC